MSCRNACWGSPGLALAAIMQRLPGGPALAVARVSWWHAEGPAGPGSELLPSQASQGMERREAGLSHGHLHVPACLPQPRFNLHFPPVSASQPAKVLPACQLRPFLPPESQYQRPREGAHRPGTSSQALPRAAGPGEGFSAEYPQRGPPQAHGHPLCAQLRGSKGAGPKSVFPGRRAGVLLRTGGRAGPSCAP